jgi:hypothetical protein
MNRMEGAGAGSGPVPGLLEQVSPAAASAAVARAIETPREAKGTAALVRGDV